MDRRTVLTGLGLAAATSSLTAPVGGQESPRWSAPVIDMHFHIRRSVELNIAHQQGAGIAAANVLTPASLGSSATALQAQNPTLFPSWFGSTDITKTEAGQILTQAVKNG